MKIIQLQALLMDNGELISNGKTLGFEDQLKEFISEPIEPNLKIQKAYSQIFGFHRCCNGDMLGDLVKAMDLTKAEFETLKEQGMLEFLEDDYIAEIISNLS